MTYKFFYISQQLDQRVRIAQSFYHAFPCRKYCIRAQNSVNRAAKAHILSALIDFVSSLDDSPCLRRTAHCAILFCVALRCQSHSLIQLRLAFLWSVHGGSVELSYLLSARMRFLFMLCSLTLSFCHQVLAHRSMEQTIKVYVCQWERSETFIFIKIKIRQNMCYMFIKIKRCSETFIFIKINVKSMLVGVFLFNQAGAYGGGKSET